ncbi:RHS repeat-associated core domain-containing protein [Clostridium sp. ATCC 25772]|uniref:RHS repeat-associated core domain-containing protein n=1 Tax=Clostridium sp. ATCC 25772 TaxID=1676991 RepID=UPI001FA76A8A|nr:RHS repeat-associated core domain-containing protein [Clostridium sp. ATCC 25772]
MECHLKSLGEKNPYRYRGYRYDTETGYYYLQSRYYNPEWGRFLNVDGLVSTGQGMLSRICLLIVLIPQ